MKIMSALVMVSSVATSITAHQTNSFAIEQLFPASASTFVLDTCMQVCSDLVQLEHASERIPSYWLDALLGKMVRLQAGIERLATHNQPDIRLHADDLVYLLAMINRVEVAYESTQCDPEYQRLYSTTLETIKGSLVRLLTKLYS